MIKKNIYKYIDIISDIIELYNEDKTGYLRLSKSIDDYPNEPIDNDNPYYMCSYCHISDPQITIDGHRYNCEWVSMFNKLELLKSQLPLDIINKLDDYIKELEY